MNIKLIVIIVLILLILYLFFKMNNKNEHAGNTNNTPIGFSREAYNTFATVISNNNVIMPTATIDNINTKTGNFNNNVNAKNINISDTLTSNNVILSNNQSAVDGKYNSLQGNTISGTNGTINGDINTKNINIDGTATIGGSIKITNFNPTGNGSLGNIISNNINSVDGIFSENISGVDGIFSGNISGGDGIFNNNITGKNGTFRSSLSGIDGTFTGNINSNSGDFNTLNVGNMNVAQTFTGPATRFNNFTSTTGVFDLINSNKIVSEEASIKNIKTKNLVNTKDIILKPSSSDPVNINFNKITGTKGVFTDISSNKLNTNNLYVYGDNSTITSKNNKFNNIDTLDINNNNGRIFAKTISDVNNILSENIIVKNNLDTNIVYFDNILKVNGEDINWGNGNIILDDRIDRLCFSPSKCFNNNLSIIKSFESQFVPRQNVDLINLKQILSPLYLPNSDISDNCLVWDNNTLRTKLIEGNINSTTSNDDIVVQSTLDSTSRITDKATVYTGSYENVGLSNGSLWNGKFLYSTIKLHTVGMFSNWDTNQICIEIKVPEHPNKTKGIDYTVLWIQVLNDHTDKGRWTFYKVHTGPNSSKPNKSFGKFTGGYKKSALSFPNPTQNYNNNLDITNFYWMPIPIDLTDITDRKIRVSTFMRQDGIFFTQIAFSTNPYNHCKLNAGDMYGQINKFDTTTSTEIKNFDFNRDISKIYWSSSLTGANIKEQLCYFAPLFDINFRIPFVNNGKDKVFYISERYDDIHVNGKSFDVSFNILGTGTTYNYIGQMSNVFNKENLNPIEQFYTNKFTENNYYFIVIPANRLPQKGLGIDNFLNIRINIRIKNNVTNTITNDNTNMFFKEVGTHDVIS
jgi:hypothetical protein